VSVHTRISSNRDTHSISWTKKAPEGALARQEVGISQNQQRK
jgi:hypothetical protein